MIELTEDNLQELIQANQRVIVKFSATWCGNCRLLKPKFKRLSEEINSVAFVLVDAEKFPESRKLATVNNLPTFAVFQNGLLINQIQTNREENIKKLINEVANN